MTSANKTPENKPFPAPKLAVDNGDKPASTFHQLPDATTHECAKQTTDEFGLRDRVSIRHGANIIHVPELKGWYVWNGRRWQEDSGGCAVSLMTQRTIELLVDEAECLVRETPADTAAAREKRLKFASSCRKAKTVNATMELMRAHSRRSSDHLDADDFLLSVANGVINLKTGDLIAPEREHYITKGTNIAYDPAAKCPTWLHALSQIFAGDKDMLAFIQRAVGYSLTGSTAEQVMFMCHGGGSNGKSIVLETIGRLVGDYAMATRADTLMVSDKKSGIPNDIARLRGARFVSCSETQRTGKLDEATVKSITGGDRVTARFMGREFFEYVPRYKIWLATNHLPQIDGSDKGIWRRIIRIPFAVEFVDADKAQPGQPVKDKDLLRKLEAELPGILAWAVEGAKQLLSNGLNPPASIVEAVEDYKADSDVLADFLEICTTKDPNGRVPAGQLFKTYEAFCRLNGQRAISETSFGRALSERGFKKGRSNGIYRSGLKLTEYALRDCQGL